MNNFIIKDTDGNDMGNNPDKITVNEWKGLKDSFPTGLDLVRRKCYDCSGENWAEVKKCTVIHCPLWPVRMGKVPKNYRKASENE